MASHWLTTHSFLFTVTFLILAPIFKANAAEDSDLVLNGRDVFAGDVTAQVIAAIFVGLTFIDVIIQTLMILYVFITLIFSSKTIADIFYTLLGALIFIVVRAAIIPIILQTAPYDWIPVFPTNVTEICVYINLSCIVFFYGLSSLSCVYFLIRIGVTGKKMSSDVNRIVDKKSGIQPMVVILMPIYNEEPNALFRAVESAIRCDYPGERKHVFLAFDDESESVLFFSLLKKLKVLSKDVSNEIKDKLEKRGSLKDTGNKMIFPPRLEWVIEGVRLTVCRFPHEGKSPTQGKSFKIINEIYGKDSEMAANTLVLFIDSDIILHENALHNFVMTAINKPKLKGATGLVTCRTSRKFNIYQYLQDSEYVDGQMFGRTAECSMGAVSCLPGALTLIRLNALQEVAPKYFIEFDKERNVDFHRYHLGEDRYMTYLLIESSDNPYQVTFVSSAQCKTDAPDSFQKLLKQRRRWFLGGLTNDVCMIASPLMWRKTPFMVVFKLYFYSIKGMDWLLGVMVLYLIKSQTSILTILLIFLLLAIRFLLSSVTAVLMKRYKICFTNLLLFFVVPFFSLIVVLYSIFTWNVRSWGGPRTDSDEEIEVSKSALIDDVMKQREEPTGTTRRSLQQIETISKLMDKKYASDDKSLNSHTIDIPTITEEPPVKKFVPFPYESEFLGGGEFNENLLQPLPPGSPLLHRKRLPENPNFLTESSSMPNLSILSPINKDYVFGKLSRGTREKAASFRLDIDYLAKMEDLGTLDNSSQRGSSFNLRLSGRSTPVESREPSIYSFDISSANVSNPSNHSISSGTATPEIPFDCDT